MDNLPSNLTHLTFGCYFNQEVYNLPKNLTHLTFGFWFNKSVDNLPYSHMCEKIANGVRPPEYLTHLTFGHQFNKSVDATRKNKIFTGAPKNNIVFDGDNLPASLTHLIFGNSFNYKVYNLPLTMKEIMICKQQIHLLKKIPFNCKIIDEDNKEIFL